MNRSPAIHTLWQATLHGAALEHQDPTATFKPLGIEGLEGIARTLGVEEVTSAPTPPPAAPRSHTPRSGLAQGELSYRLKDTVGRGGMAVVYRARQHSLERDVAMKMPRLDQDSAGRFLSEALLTGSLGHPNIVPVHDLVEVGDGRLAMAMKLVEGEPWSTRLDAADRTDPSVLVDEIVILRAVCNAVAFAHSRGVLHCDLKPDNVMIGAFGEVLVMDWGCALVFTPECGREAPPGPRSTEIARPFGTPAYMPPELALGEGERIGPATDVFLLGAILYEILSGDAPNLRDTFLATLGAAVGDQPPRPLPSTVPRALARIAERALARAPEDRHSSVEAFGDELAHWLHTRESGRLVDDARQVLEEGTERARERLDPEGRRALYRELEAAVAGTGHARRLWSGNAEAGVIEAGLRRLLVETALRQGDPGIAEAHAPYLDETPESEGLRKRVAAEVQARTQSARHARMLRMGLGVALAGIALTAGLGYLQVSAQHARAEQAAALAASRLEAIEQLSDMKLLRDHVALADTLWPALPERVEALSAWLDEARELVGRADRHRAQRDLLQAEMQLEQDAADSWHLATLNELLEGLAVLQQEYIPDVEKRLTFAETVHARSLVEPAEAWARTAEELRADPRFAGVELKPQVGLVPLGPDPDTGLQEFAHLASGSPPTRGPDGRITPQPGMGIVLVLLPPGSFHMGAERGRGGPNLDPMAKAIEGPVHEVHLDAFFLSKYELTQDQFEGITGYNPSAYLPGQQIGGHTMTGLHPVEQILWEEAQEALARVDLTLPTEAQWEYASRAGTRTVFWTGDAPESLQGAANLADRWARDQGGPESWAYQSYLDDGHVVHAPVGQFRPNAFGLHDTIGNVWEWCLDPMGGYDEPVAPGTGARQTGEAANQVFRGGGFRASAAHARSADRYSLYTTAFSGYDVGARAARLLR